MNEPEEKFGQATRLWDLERLYVDLASTKRGKLTPTQKEYLRGLLLGYSPKEIAEELQLLELMVKGSSEGWCAIA